MRPVPARRLLTAAVVALLLLASEGCRPSRRRAEQAVAPDERTRPIIYDWPHLSRPWEQLVADALMRSRGVPLLPGPTIASVHEYRGAYAVRFRLRDSPTRRTGPHDDVAFSVRYSAEDVADVRRANIPIAAVGPALPFGEGEYGRLVGGVVVALNVLSRERSAWIDSGGKPEPADSASYEASIGTTWTANVVRVGFRWPYPGGSNALVVVPDRGGEPRIIGGM